jgi:hypothetical protein
VVGPPQAAPSLRPFPLFSISLALPVQGQSTRVASQQTQQHARTLRAATNQENWNPKAGGGSDREQRCDKCTRSWSIAHVYLASLSLSLSLSGVVATPRPDGRCMLSPSGWVGLRARAQAKPSREPRALPAGVSSQKPLQHFITSLSLSFATTRGDKGIRAIGEQDRRRGWILTARSSEGSRQTRGALACSVYGP